MSLLDRFHAPTPKFYKNIIRISLVLSIAAVVVLNADTLGNALVPGFTFKLLPGVAVVCKNLIVAGLISAAISKFQKEDNSDNKPQL